MAGQQGDARRKSRWRQRIATGVALLVALVFGWHAIFGQNGITAYAAKRKEERALQVEIRKLGEENAKLKDHVDRLRTDPDTIEMEARQRLHYARHGEVIYTLTDPQPEDQSAAAGR